MPTSMWLHRLWVTTERAGKMRFNAKKNMWPRREHGMNQTIRTARIGLSPRAAEHKDLNKATSIEKAAGTTPFDQSGDCYNSSYHGERSDEDRDGQISGEDGDVDNVAAEGRKRQRVKQWLRHSGPRVLHVAATTAIIECQAAAPGNAAIRASLALGDADMLSSKIDM
ncbi:hypothetical protein Slin14017_G113130 [Septoria linicola]|nr:hypothetical protein Slin14017_G113130 [Septoria linicola]